MKKIILKKGREKSLLRKHPWVFSGAIQEVIGNPMSGETVEIVDNHDHFLARAAYSPSSSIRARVWTFYCDDDVNDEFIYDKLRIAINHRYTYNFLSLDTNTFRLIHAESDGLPGLVVDQYGDLLVLQILSAGIEFWRSEIIDNLVEITKIKNIFERSDVEVRKLEGLEQRVGAVHGDKLETEVEICENGFKFLVDVASGQKTGFYIDQRENRKTIQSYVENKEVLNCFSYTGAFSVYALAAGAKHVTSIESSEDANQLAERNLEINDLPIGRITLMQSDVFSELRTMRDKALSYDVIILDPPKFAPTTAQVKSAARGYKDINLLAFKLLKPGGKLITFSCSGGVSQNLFQKIIADAVLDAGKNAKIIRYLFQGPDHPVALNFPEGAYLKGLVCQVE